MKFPLRVVNQTLPGDIWITAADILFAVYVYYKFSENHSGINSIFRIYTSIFILPDIYQEHKNEDTAV